MINVNLIIYFFLKNIKIISNEIYTINYYLFLQFWVVNNEKYFLCDGGSTIQYLVTLAMKSISASNK